MGQSDKNKIKKNILNFAPDNLDIYLIRVNNVITNNFRLNRIYCILHFSTTFGSLFVIYIVNKHSSHKVTEYNTIVLKDEPS